VAQKGMHTASGCSTAFALSGNGSRSMLDREHISLAVHMLKSQPKWNLGTQSSVHLSAAVHPHVANQDAKQNFS